VIPKIQSKGFDPEIVKLIAAFAVAAERIELDDDLAEALFRTALEIYSKGDLFQRVARHDA